ncbi:histidinol-phosphate transaminase [Candidatus Gottesmanbacteria bacterium]|nr:histidinol-phosphate transaminase [Candidatus Gottesmanbacteria bacterium]
MKKTLQRKNIITLEPYTSARDLYKSGIFMDANENYEQWISIDWEGIASLNRYPDSTCDQLREKLVKKYVRGFTKENIFVGCGSDEIINLLIAGFVEDDESIMVMDPSYSFYEVQASIKNIQTKRILLREDFSIDIGKIQKNISTVKIIFLCSPNNPTGNLITKKEIQMIAKFFKGIIVVDEAYIEFADLGNSMIDSVSEKSNIIILRTFSKAWGLAGIRVGYAIGSKSIIDVLFKIKESYNVPSVSQNIAIQALDEIEKLKKKIVEMKKLKEQLLKGFSNLGLEASDTSANFILVKIPNAKKIYKNLADQKVIIRDRSNLPLLQNTLRVTIGSKEQDEKLISILRKVLYEN